MCIDNKTQNYNTKKKKQKMGSGISISDKQMLQIVQRELVESFHEEERSNRIVDDYGYLLPESFECEELYIKKMRLLSLMSMSLSMKKQI